MTPYMEWNLWKFVSAMPFFAAAYLFHAYWLIYKSKPKSSPETDPMYPAKMAKRHSDGRKAVWGALFCFLSALLVYGLLLR